MDAHTFTHVGCKYMPDPSISVVDCNGYPSFILSMIVKRGYFSYDGLSVSSNQPGHCQLTSNINKAS